MNNRVVADRELADWAPPSTVELAPAVPAARAAIEDAGRALAAIPDDRLELPWDWRGTGNDVRYGFYRIFERLDLARADAQRALDDAGVAAAEGGRLAASATGARWSLHGLLLPLTDDDLDRDPGGGEWSVRETLGHIVSAQRAYGRFTAWWLTQAGPGDLLPDALGNAMPDDAEESVGTLTEIRRRLDALLDQSMASLGGLGAEDLEARAGWSGVDMTVGFRMVRWTSHLREHTIQVEKTLVMLGRPTTEVDRLVRLVLEGYGRLEATVFGLDRRLADTRGPGGTSASEVIEAASTEVAELVPEIVAAASAGSADRGPTGG